MTLIGPWPKKWKDTRNVTFDVYPTAYQGTLNYGLSRQHALGGIFPTAESLAARARGESPRDELTLVDKPIPSGGFGNIPRAATGGMQAAGLQAVRLNIGETLYRFGDAGGHKGGWWSGREGLFRILLRVEPTQQGMPGVRGGSELGIRDYARKYSEVLGEWGSQMKYLYATQLRGAVMAFRGMGASQRSKEITMIEGADGRPHAVTYEHMSDDNRQIFIPNVYTRIDGAPPGEPAFFAPVVKWHPEVLEQCLVPLIRTRLGRGEKYRAIIGDVEAWMMRGDRKAQFGDLTPPALSG
ncbi:hypothetical protein [Polyangium fumosum]|uniref:Uncharacterized protein n=1 Tax=Polyangium fumosum TaxID=889272 RepID=A0A4U1JKM2_9BACT|nr:hypothetical protein [Polyangium fumosum]TKD13316.1 hypothetical protein E8A74_01845 [Polyangium fumosum]